MTHVVIGIGEVGKALQEILGCDGVDREIGLAAEHYDFMHVCIPYSEHFEEIIKSYQVRFSPNYTVIHSTVPIGTTRKLDANHSPIRGRHPDLAKSIVTFTKYIAGPQASEIADEFNKFGMKTKVFKRADETEAGKLIDLMQYGAAILLNKEIHKFCEENSLDFDIVYKHFNLTYNRGYRKLGFKEFIRPILKYMPGKIGGHCVTQMMPLLSGQLETATKILTENEKL